MLMVKNKFIIKRGLTLHVYTIGRATGWFFRIVNMSRVDIYLGHSTTLLGSAGT